MTKAILMGIGCVRLAALGDGATRLERRRLFGLWWQQVKRLPVEAQPGVRLEQATAARREGGGWDARMVWSEGKNPGLFERAIYVADLADRD